MSTARVGPRDVTATFIVAALITLFGLWRSGTQIAGMGSPRAVAAVVLVLGLLACAVGARGDTFTDKSGAEAMPPITRVLSVLGGGTVVVGIVAVVSGSESLLTVLVVLTVALWLSATIRHLAVPMPRRDSLRSAALGDEPHAPAGGVTP